MIVAVILAAGRSERMHRPKPLLPCGDTTFLGRILETLGESRVDRVQVVLGHRSEEVRGSLGQAAADFTVNESYDAGMLSSIQCGVRQLPRETRGFLIWPVDHPLVRVATVDRLIDEFFRGDASLVLPVHDGRRGHPVLFSSRLAMELMDAPPGRGARAVVHAHAEDRLEIPVDDGGVVTDIDTPRAYADVFGHPPPD